MPTLLLLPMVLLPMLLLRVSPGYEPDDCPPAGRFSGSGDGQGQGAELPHDPLQPAARCACDRQGRTYRHIFRRAGGEEALPAQVAQGAEWSSRIENGSARAWIFRGRRWEKK